ncbi:MAG: ABC transporter ATP-binding protein/permease [Alphaproteobacteria bacterium]|nr:ABC transporter ATP-binding protein/permease [Alphaproteobacteria bacterium]
MKYISNPYFHLVALSWHHAVGHRKKFVVFYVLSILANIALLFLPYLLGKVFDVLQRNPPEIMNELSFWMALYAGFTFLYWLLHGPSRVMERKIAFHIRQHFVDDMYRRVKELPMKWHQNNHSGNTINRINKASRGLYDFSQVQFLYIMYIIGFFGPLIALMFVSPIVALLAMISGVITTLVIRRYDQKLVPLLEEENELEHNYSSAFFDYVSNIATIISLRIGGRTRSELNRRLGNIYPVVRRTIVINEWKWFSLTICRVTIEVAILLFYIWIEVRNGNPLMVGAAVMVYQYLRRLSEIAVGLAQNFELIIRWRTDYNSAQYIQEAHKALPQRSNIDEVRDWKELQLKNVRFSYEGREHKIHHIDDIAININRGQRIALVGHSGSGKSTLLGLLRGMFEAHNAEVFVDGEEKSRDINILQKLITLIPQDPEIFENTILYNITTGMEHNPDELQWAIDTACFTPVVEQLEKGLETDIRERGVNLSGGQKQRLALSRGIFAARSSSILLLDEPTSSIDSTTERQIYNNIFSAFPEAAIISSIHRLHLLEEFDWIYVMEDGAIIEEGSLKDLLDHKGAFSEMWKQYSQQNED